MTFRLGEFDLELLVPCSECFIVENKSFERPNQNYGASRIFRQIGTMDFGKNAGYLP